MRLAPWHERLTWLVLLNEVPKRKWHFAPLNERGRQPAVVEMALDLRPCYDLTLT